MILAKWWSLIIRTSVLLRFRRDPCCRTSDACRCTPHFISLFVTRFKNYLPFLFFHDSYKFCIRLLLAFFPFSTFSWKRGQSSNRTFCHVKKFIRQSSVISAAMFRDSWKQMHSTLLRFFVQTQNHAWFTFHFTSLWFCVGVSHKNPKVINYVQLECEKMWKKLKSYG